MSVYTRICRFLSESGVAFHTISHKPTYSSSESARERGEALETGAKALFIKCDEGFCLAVIPATKKLDSKALRKMLGARRIRFATLQELADLTGLVPGSVPPFGAPILPFRLLVDDNVGSERDRIAFNAGSLTESITMRASDWKQLAKPTLGSFAK